MHGKSLKVLLVCAMLALFSCGKKSHVIEEVAGNHTEEFQIDSLISHLKIRLSDSGGLAPCITDFRHLSLLRLYYGQNDYSKMIIQNWGESEWQELDSIMIELPAQGLDPRMYHYPLLRFYLDSLERTATYNYALMAQIEFLCADALVSLSHDLKGGRLNPKELFGSYYHIPFQAPGTESILEVFDQPLKSLRSHFLQDEDAVKLGIYKSELIEKQWQSGEWPQIDFSNFSKLKEGDRFRNFSLIGKRLFAEGLIDSAVMRLMDTTVYISEAVTYIKLFQAQRNLFDDGVIGANTQEALNQSISERIAEIDANLERKRWIRDLLTSPMLVVNLPDYRLNMHYGDSVSSMKVCIGVQRPADYNRLLKLYLRGQNPSKPKNHETPQVYSKVSHMVLNPTWTVPKSIVLNEMLPKMKRDAGYLKRNHYIILRNGKEVPHDSVNWHQVNPAAYVIRQTPGTHNALGKIKFMFVNPFNVYMHDTPSQGPFSQPERDVSHGCVRLEKPLELSDFIGYFDERIESDNVRIILGYPPISESRLRTYDPNDSTALVRRSAETKVMHLAKPIPVLFDYRTIFTDNSGQVQVRFDAYRKQKTIQQALRASF